MRMPGSMIGIKISQMESLELNELIRLSAYDDCPAEVFLKLNDLSYSKASKAHFYLIEGLKNKKLSSKTLNDLYKNGNNDIIKIMLENSNLPESIINDVLQKGTIYQLNLLSANSNISEKTAVRILEKAIALDNISVVINLINNKRLNLVFLISAQEKIEKSFPNKRINLSKYIIDYIISADDYIISKIYPMCVNNEEYLLAIIRNKNTSSKILEDICFNTDSRNIFVELSKNSNINKKVFEKLFKLHDLDIIVELVKNPYSDYYSDEIIKLIEEYKDKDYVFLDNILRNLSKKMDKITSEESIGSVYVLVEELIKLKNEDVDQFLASNNRFLNKYQTYDFIESASDKALKAFADCKDGTYNLANYYVCTITKDPDTFAKCFVKLKNDNSLIFALLGSPLVKKVIRSNHPLSKEVSKIYKSTTNLFDIVKKNSKRNVNLSSRFKDMMLGNTINAINYPESGTSLIKATDEVSINKNGKIIIKPENIDVIIRNLDNEKDKSVVYGKYPCGYTTRIESGSLDSLHRLNLLENTGKTYKMIGENGYVYIYEEYKFGDRFFVRVTEGNEIKWMESIPLLWMINEDKTLELSNHIPNVDEHTSEEFISRMFISDILEPFNITDEELKYKNEIEKERSKTLGKFKATEVKQKESTINKELEEEHKKVLHLIDELKKTIALLEKDKVVSTVLLDRLRSSIDIPEDILIVNVGDHKEFNPEYIELLPYINLVTISTIKNLKFSGTDENNIMDWSKTNITIFVDNAYNKDLSYCIFADDNLRLQDLSDCNLSGSDLSTDTLCFGYDNAIIDEFTKLPDRLNKISINKTLN